MKKLLYFAAALLVLVGCNEKDKKAPANYGAISGKIELSQSANVPAHKITAPEGWAAAAAATEFTMQWESTDNIYIYNGNECKQLSNPSITDNTATF